MQHQKTSMVSKSMKAIYCHCLINYACNELITWQQIYTAKLNSTNSENKRPEPEFSQILYLKTKF